MGAVLSGMADVAARRDVEAAVAQFADDPDVFLYGTCLDEWPSQQRRVREATTGTVPTCVAAAHTSR